jgi:hypothetical protein
MDIDLSKVLLIVLAVLPGYLALRGSDRVIPRTQRKKGATEEIAEFFIFSVLAHFILTLLYSCFSILAGLLYKGSAMFYVGGWIWLTPSDLLKKLGSIPAGYMAIYLFLSLGIGWLLGLGLGLLDAWRTSEWVARKLGIENSWLGRFWSKHIERFLITGRPIFYDALFPDLDKNGEQKDVFAELVMKGDQGCVTGRVAGFSIANDEESHKLVYLKDVFRKSPGSTQYEKLDADGMLVDFADAITVQIKQM